MAEDEDTEDDDGEDSGLAVVRHVADANTVRSVKATLLTALLVWSVRRSRHPPRRSMLVAAGAGVALVLQHDGLTGILHFLG